ncbi:MAG: hypothetical protein HON98_05555 [Chloroflexi bacterium]|jgi:hypothetical protein|nr:hypothetical protein [Chloroflexota bacterium]MBT4306186.1 hypothetical protein [Chloroflexota bacterium]MBT4534566.1 hypothetical protein [Chloroflexota bacterium]MBT4682810.1 hypothetical protein [Chloroflexota bacterium]MBT4755138.1 hypothetical protein [Chloroflexota bacterium]
MNKKTANILKITVLSLPVFLIFLPLFFSLKFYIFRIEIAILMLAYIFFMVGYYRKKPLQLFSNNKNYQKQKEFLFITILSSTAITIWFYIEGFFGNEIIRWFNSSVSMLVFQKSLIQPENLLAGQIGFFTMVFLFSIPLGILNFIIYKVGKKENKNIFLKYKKTVVFISLLSILTCVFSSELFQNNAGRGSNMFWGGTEDYINFRIRNGLSFMEDLKEFGGFNHGFFMEEPFKVYLSHTGFWGSALKFIQSIFNVDPEAFLIGARITFSLIYSTIILGFGYKLSKKFGIITGGLFIIPQIFTYWILGPSKHLLWVYPLFFVPFFHSLFRYPKVVVNEITTKRFFIEQTLVFSLVFLRGYEYLSNVILFAIVPILYVELKNRAGLKQIFKKLTPTGIAGGLALISVLGFHLIQLVQYLGGLSDALLYFNEKATHRLGFNSSVSYWKVFLEWLDVRFLYFPETGINNINTFENSINGISIGEIHLFFFFVLLIAVLMKKTSKNMKNISLLENINIVFYVGVSTIFSVFASWTWFINKGHMLPHAHMNGIMYIVPFGFCLFIFFSIFLQTFLDYLDYYSVDEIGQG